jgi:carbamoyltransferase
MSLVLGLNAYHGDSAASLLKDGRLVAAAEEERFRRVKHWAGFPSQAIAYCLEESGASLSDINHVAVNSDPKANLLRKISHVLLKRPEVSLIRDRLKNRKDRLSIVQELAQAFPGQRFAGQIHHIEHHLAHLASCFLVSPFEEAATISVDGFGDFSSAAWGVGRGDEIAIDGRVYFPHSLGIFYQALTQYLGFPNYGDEYKVMGLAPYGQPTYLRQMREIVKLEDGGGFKLNTRYFRHHREKINYEWSGGSPKVGTLYTSALEELLGAARPKMRLSKNITI